MKPIIGITGGFNYIARHNEYPDGHVRDMAALKTVVAAVLFGVEGRISNWVSFHSEFRRDPGYYGTSVWEGTASLSAMDNWLRLEHWGASISAGIVSDPASLDFLSVHMTDLFLADDFSRQPILNDGFNRGQGLLAQYKWNGLTVGLMFSAGNPLTTSLSYGFGGAVGPNGNLFFTPLREISLGNPGLGTDLDTLSPSLMFEHKWFEARANTQFYWANADTEDSKGVTLKGQLYRVGLKGKFFSNVLQVFGNFTYRRNDMFLQASPIDITKLNDTGTHPGPYQALVVSAGADCNFFGASGIGVNYAYIRTQAANLPIVEQHYLNIGATYWVIDNASVGVRYSKLISMTDGKSADGTPDKDAFFITLRLVI